MRCRRRLGVLLAAALALGAAGCSGDPAPVEMGEGRMPDTMPADFPIPAGAEIGATLVDHSGSRTEVSIRVDGEVDQLVRFYTVELVSTGFVVERSEPASGRWRISFSRGDLRGSITLAAAGDAVTAAVVEINRATGG